MEFDTGAFLIEHEHSDVDASIVIDTDPTEGYRIAEKWRRPESDGGEVWHTYWIPEELVEQRIESGDIEYNRDLSDKQLRGIRKLAGVQGEPQPA